MVIHILAQLFEHTGHQFGLVRRVKPVRTEGKELHRTADLIERFMERFVTEGDIVEIERFCQIQERVCIKPVDKVVAVVIQVAFDLELPEKIEKAVFGRVPAAELGLHRLIRKKSDVTYAAGKGKPVLGVLAVRPHLPVRINEDRPPGNGVKAYCLRRRGGSCGKGYDRRNPVRILGPPLEGLHPPHASPKHRHQSFYAEMIEKKRLCTYHVTHGNDREGKIVTLAGPGVYGRRS